MNLKNQTNERQVLYSKKRLIQALERKFKTCFIGALAEFEKQFSDLWEDDNEWRAKWEATRTHVLNNGNNQLRAAIDEVSQYTMTWDKHNVNFIVKQPEEESSKKHV